MKYRVNNRWLSYETKGHKQFGGEKILLQDGVDLTSGQNWNRQGFTIAPLFSPKVFANFYQQTCELLFSRWRAAGLNVPPDFSPDQYHRLANSADRHLAAIEQTRLLPTEAFPLGIPAIEECISSLLGQKLKARNPYDGQSAFHFRVIRPDRSDNNPLHRDVWLADYDNCINLYIPIAGSNECSSLILISGSHHWPESRIERTVSGGEIDGVKFNVPAVTDIRGDYSIERPNPGLNEVLVFSPYLIHGGAVNLNEDITRISIELRLWKHDQEPNLIR
jgi:hypothetical protein